MFDPRGIGRVRFGGALFVAEALKALSILSIVGGAILGAAVFQTAEDSGIAIAAALEAAGGTAVCAATLAFFGYILEVAVEVYEQVWHIRYADDDSEDSG